MKYEKVFVPVKDSDDCDFTLCDVRMIEKQNVYVMSEEELKDLLDTFEEVIRISDRKHTAWDKAKTLISKLKTTTP